MYRKIKTEARRTPGSELVDQNVAPALRFSLRSTYSMTRRGATDIDQHRPDQLWTEAICEVTCLEKEGYVDTSSLTRVFKTDIIPLAKAHVTHSPTRFLKKNVNSGCKCKIKTNNPDLVKYFNRMGAPLMQFKIYHKLRGSHHAREWLKKHNITVQFPHRPESETLSGSQKENYDSLFLEGPSQ
ncbi:unnamed protein product [Bemisia tabaci]|uniref:Uncharacterized protein n=1 Tax=Bemisia tabaci TaxID=7038 RepID=A0A9P0F7J3_BEMTA|nr:unnamed protein product [Bemisia tabaci]